MKITRKIILFHLFIYLFCFTSNITFQTKIDFLLGTIFEIKIEKIKNSEELLKKAFELVKYLENKMSVFNEESEISMLNKNKKYKVSPEVLEVIKKSIFISKITDGAFDITCKPLIEMYKNMAKENKLPTEKEIKNILKRIGWEKIVIKDNEIILKNGMEIDLGGIAKGYIVDKVAEFLRNNDVENGLINAGGDIYCWSKNSDWEKWKIGIEDPFAEGKIVGCFEITNRGIATSGNYKRYMKIKGKKIGHIVNPKTGYLVKETPESVTIIASDCATADGFATGIFVLGIEKGLKLINELKDIECLLIDKNKNIYKSKNFPPIKNNFNF